jgi:hypothetical protein
MSRKLIKKLLRNYVTKDILADEAKVDFNQRKVPSYSFPSYGHQQHAPNHANHGPFNPYGNFYGPSVANQ